MRETAQQQLGLRVKNESWSENQTRNDEKSNSLLVVLKPLSSRTYKLGQAFNLGNWQRWWPAKESGPFTRAATLGPTTRGRSVSLSGLMSYLRVMRT
jgi:hypothetical protein